MPPACVCVGEKSRAPSLHAAPLVLWELEVSLMLVLGNLELGLLRLTLVGRRWREILPNLLDGLGVQTLRGALVLRDRELGILGLAFICRGWGEILPDILDGRGVQTLWCALVLSRRGFERLLDALRVEPGDCRRGCHGDDGDRQRQDEGELHGDYRVAGCSNQGTEGQAN